MPTSEPLTALGDHVIDGFHFAVNHWDVEELDQGLLQGYARTSHQMYFGEGAGELTSSAQEQG